MASQVDICNIALGLLGANKIGSISEGSTESMACQNNWSVSRDATLASMHWSFARKRAELSQSSTDPAFTWDYQYPLPADFLAPVVVNEGSEPKWVIEGSMLLTNEDEVELVYIYRVQNTALYSALFVDALAARLAADIAPAVTRDFALQQKMMQLFDFKVGRAFDHDAAREMEYERPDMDQDNYTWISVRR